MRSRGVAAAITAGLLALPLAACAVTPRLTVGSVQFTPTGEQEPTVATTSQEPFILPSGVAGTIDVFFTMNVAPDQCTLTLDGVQSVKPVPLTEFLNVDYVVRLKTTGLSVDRLAQGNLQCGGAGSSFGSRAANDDFNVATQLVIVMHVDPRQVDFPTTQAESQSRNEAILLGNVGSLPVDVTAVRISGSSAADFRFVDEPCSGQALGRTELCEVKVVFAPQSAGSKTAILEFELVSTDPKNPDSVTEIVLLRGTASAAPTPTPVPQPTEPPPHHPPVG